MSAWRTRRKDRKQGGACAPVPARCRSTSAPVTSLREIVDAYIRDVRPRADRERFFYAEQPNLGEAISKAALARTERDKRHPHQTRIPGAALEQARQRLTSADLESATSFEELHARVEAAIGGIEQIGELAIYDTALRIGAFLHLEPRLVYLHRGTRDGAQALGLGRGRTTLAVDELPDELGRLQPSEIEDCLCIYEPELATLAL